jgi:hypothetical protein
MGQVMRVAARAGFGPPRRREGHQVYLWRSSWTKKMEVGWSQVYAGLELRLLRNEELGKSTHGRWKGVLSRKRVTVSEK